MDRPVEKSFGKGGIRKLPDSARFYEGVIYFTPMIDASL
jgi:hypothetical protein